LQCRSQVIGNYFGDEKMKPCGICDNCLSKKATIVSKEEFEQIHQRIVDCLLKGTVHSKDLMMHLNGIKKEKAWKVIEFLQAEDKIGMNKSGIITLK
ncbi:MAG TPA: RecQ family zinc-binding domain-containing protein, partial [Chitinophagaceae bacterium]